MVQAVYQVSTVTLLERLFGEKIPVPPFMFYAGTEPFILDDSEDAAYLINPNDPGEPLTFLEADAYPTS